MAIKAYLLINTHPGQSDEVVKELSSLSEATEVHRVTGPYDVIMEIETESLHTLGTKVNDYVHSLEGVRSTLSCLRVRE